MKTNQLLNNIQKNNIELNKKIATIKIGMYACIASISNTLRSYLPLNKKLSKNIPELIPAIKSNTITDLKNESSNQVLANNVKLPAEITQKQEKITSLINEIDLLEKNMGGLTSKDKNLFVYVENANVESAITEALKQNYVNQQHPEFQKIIKDQEYVIDNLTQKLNGLSFTKKTSLQSKIDNISSSKNLLTSYKKEVIAENNHTQTKKPTENQYTAEDANKELANSTSSDINKFITPNNDETDGFIYNDEYQDDGYSFLTLEKHGGKEIDFDNISKNTLYNHEPSYLLQMLESDNNNKNILIEQLELENTQQSDDLEDYRSVIQETRIDSNEKNKIIRELKQPNEKLRSDNEKLKETIKKLREEKAVRESTIKQVATSYNKIAAKATALEESINEKDLLIERLLKENAQLLNQKENISGSRNSLASNSSGYASEDDMTDSRHNPVVKIASKKSYIPRPISGYGQQKSTNENKEIVPSITSRIEQKTNSKQFSLKATKNRTQVRHSENTNLLHNGQPTK